MFCAIIYDEYGEGVIKVIGPFEDEESAIDEGIAVFQTRAITFQLEYTNNINNIETAPFELIEGE